MKMADIKKCKECKYYQRVVDYSTDPEGCCMMRVCVRHIGVQR